jgi:hypothetical protein
MSISKETLQDPIKTTELINELFDQAQILSKSSFDWPVYSTHGNITTRRKRKEPTDGQNHYFQRSSIHEANQVTYDQLRAILFVNHSLNEPKYIKDLTDAVLLEKINEEADVFWLGFKTPPLSANREFVELVAARELERCFMVVSQPVVGYDRQDSSNGYVRGAYQAWEIVSEKEIEGKRVVEWVCIQHSSAGGSVPSFITDWVAGKDFYHDVEAIIKYIKIGGLV